MQLQPCDETEAQPMANVENIEDSINWDADDIDDNLLEFDLDEKKLILIDEPSEEKEVDGKILIDNKDSITPDRPKTLNRYNQLVW